MEIDSKINVLKYYKQHLINDLTKYKELEKENLRKIKELEKEIAELEVQKAITKVRKK